MNSFFGSTITFINNALLLQLLPTLFKRKHALSHDRSLGLERLLLRPFLADKRAKALAIEVIALDMIGELALGQTKP